MIFVLMEVTYRKVLHAYSVISHVVHVMIVVWVVVQVAWIIFSGMVRNVCRFVEKGSTMMDNAQLVMRIVFIV